MEKRGRGRPRIGSLKTFTVEEEAYALFKSKVKRPSEKIRELVKDFTVRELLEDEELRKIAIEILKGDEKSEKI